MTSASQLINDSPRSTWPFLQRPSLPFLHYNRASAPPLGLGSPSPPSLLQAPQSQLFRMRNYRVGLTEKEEWLAQVCQYVCKKEETEKWSLCYERALFFAI